jgi:hypothetical protein
VGEEQKEPAMANNNSKGDRKQVGLNIRTALYDDLTKIAKDNGQTTTYLLEQAVEHYLRYIAPSQETVRPEMMAHLRKSIEKNRDLLKLLAE